MVKHLDPPSLGAKIMNLFSIIGPLVQDVRFLYSTILFNCFYIQHLSSQITYPIQPEVSPLSVSDIPLPDILDWFADRVISLLITMLTADSESDMASFLPHNYLLGDTPCNTV